MIALLKKEAFPPTTELWINGDEATVSVKEEDLERMTQQIQSLLLDVPSQIGFKGEMKVESFRVWKLSTSLPYFCKEIFTTGTNAKPHKTLKGVPPEHFALCYKHIHSLPVTVADTKIAWDTTLQSFVHIDKEHLHLVPFGDDQLGATD